MLQLKYRYDREIGMAERSCLKRILNGDDSTYRPMVLCISAVLLEKDVVSDHKLSEMQEVTKSSLVGCTDRSDGWVVRGQSTPGRPVVPAIDSRSDVRWAEVVHQSMCNQRSGKRI